MSEQKIFLCTSDDLWERGRGVRFHVMTPGGAENAFAVRYEGTAYAYINRCMHLPQEMDWTSGEFFDDECEYLICASHGALYRPQDGVCVAGPCRGASLLPVPLEETGAGVFWIASERVRPLSQPAQALSPQHPDNTSSSHD